MGFRTAPLLGRHIRALIWTPRFLTFRHGMILSSSSCLTHQKIRRVVYGKAWAIDARSPSAGSPTISATLACIFEHPAKRAIASDSRAIASDSFAARRLDLHRRELRPDAIDRLPAIPQHAQAARNAGRAPWPLRDDVAAARPRRPWRSGCAPR